MTDEQVLLSKKKLETLTRNVDRLLKIVRVQRAALDFVLEKESEDAPQYSEIMATVKNAVATSNELAAGKESAIVMPEKELVVCE